MERDVLIGIISASSALGGVVVSQFFALLKAHFEHKHQKKIMLRSKYEDVVENLNGAILWGREVTFCQSTSELHARTVPIAARRVYSLAFLYFPKLKEPAGRFVQSCVVFHQFLSQNFTETERGTAGGQCVRKAPREFEEVSADLQAARVALDEAIEKYASTYIVA